MSRDCPHCDGTGRIDAPVTSHEDAATMNGGGSTVCECRTYAPTPPRPEPVDYRERHRLEREERRTTRGMAREQVRARFVAACLVLVSTPPSLQESRAAYRERVDAGDDARRGLVNDMCLMTYEEQAALTDAERAVYDCVLRGGMDMPKSGAMGARTPDLPTLARVALREETS